MQPCTAMGMGENGKKKMGKAALSYLLCQGEPCWSIPSQKQLSLFWNVLSSLQHIPPFPEVCLLSHIPVCSCCSHSLSKPWQSCCEWHRCVLSSLEGLRATFWEEEGAPGCGRNGWDGSSSARNGMEFASGLMERLCLGWNPPQGTLARGGGTKSGIPCCCSLLWKHSPRTVLKSLKHRAGGAPVLPLGPVSSRRSGIHSYHG